MNHPMTPDEEYEFYARPESQEPQGAGRRRLTATVPVRFPPELLESTRRGRPLRLLVDSPRGRTRNFAIRLNSRNQRSTERRFSTVPVSKSLWLCGNRFSRDHPART